MSWKNEQEKIKKSIKWKEKCSEIVKELEGYDFFLNVSSRWGVGENLYHLFWWDIKINSEFLKDEYKDYTDIILSPYRINEQIISEIAQKDDRGIWIVNKSRWGRSEIFPHIDVLTGNIHPEWDYETWDGTIKQLTLVTNKNNEHMGPRLSFAKGDDLADTNNIPCMVFQKDSNRRGNWIGSIAVPEECYFPQIFENDGFDNMTLKDMIDAYCKRIMK